MKEGLKEIECRRLLAHCLRQLFRDNRPSNNRRKVIEPGQVPFRCSAEEMVMEERAWHPWRDRPCLPALWGLRWTLFLLLSLTEGLISEFCTHPLGESQGTRA